MDLESHFTNNPLAISHTAVSYVQRCLQSDPRIVAVGLEEFFPCSRSTANAYLKQTKEETRQWPEAGPKTAVISVRGYMTHRSVLGFPSNTYAGIRRDLRTAMANPNVETVLFDFESYGGEFAGLLDLADEIYAARGKKLIFAICNEWAFSAAYVLASSAHRVWMPRTGQTGSVGVVLLHYEQSRLEERVGVKFTAIYYGSRKADFSPHQPISEKAKSFAQARVDRFGDLMVETVARNRNLSKDIVRQTQGGIFDGEDAVKVGFADEVITVSDAMEKLRSGQAKKEVESMAQKASISSSITTHGSGNDVAANSKKDADLLVTSARNRAGSAKGDEIQERQLSELKDAAEEWGRPAESSRPDVLAHPNNPLILCAQKRAETVENDGAGNPLVSKARQRAGTAEENSNTA